MDNSDIIKSVAVESICNSATLFLTFTAFFLVVLLMYRHSSNENRNRRDSDETIHMRDLPSPTAYPIVGHMLKLGPLPHLVLTEWSKKYGPLIRIKMGFQEALVVSGLDMIKTALVKNSTAFAGRPDLETSKLFNEGLSLSFSDYSGAWEHQKMVAKSAVALYTTSKDPAKRSVMEHSSYKHANNLVDLLLKDATTHKDNTVDPRDHVLMNASNAICEVCFGQDFDTDNPKLQKLLSLNRNFDKAMTASQPVNFWPVLHYCPFIAQSFRDLKTYTKHYMDFIISMLTSHWRTYEEDYMRDLVDCLYFESEKERRNNNEKSIKNGVIKHDVNSNGNANGFENVHAENGYHEIKQNQSIVNPYVIKDRSAELELRKRITYTVGDIFGAGYDTTFSMIHWALLYMAVHPDFQAKMREEIDDMIPPSEPPSYRLHGNKCSYTIAWMYELLRHCSPAALLLPHSTTKNVVLGKCVIPKGTTVYFNAWEAHRNPDIWIDPESFNPMRFLVEKDGTFSLKQSCTNNLLSWGAGKRKCLGYHLSRHQLFIFITTIVRRLVIEQSVPGVEPVLPWPVTFGIALKPKNFRIKVFKRS